MDTPYSFKIGGDGVPNCFTRKLIRSLSSLRGQFADTAAYERLRSAGDPALYEVYELDRPCRPGEVLHGVSLVHPGTVGDEYFMTKGHFHAVLATGELYYCLRGQGTMLMETPEGAWATEDMRAGTVVYVPPRWAHRSVNTGATDLAMLFAYPGEAGHDYGTIEQQGFAKRVVCRDGVPTIIDNQAWLAPDQRGAGAVGTANGEGS
jgi:glucose-6-phosphate isomerase